jgi:hypothetical protein
VYLFLSRSCTLFVDDDPVQLIAERDRLNKDLELAHSTIKQLEAELDNLQVGYGRSSGRR